MQSRTYVHHYMYVKNPNQGSIINEYKLQHSLQNMNLIKIYSISLKYNYTLGNMAE